MVVFTPHEAHVTVLPFVLALGLGEALRTAFLRMSPTVLHALVHTGLLCLVSVPAAAGGSWAAVAGETLRASKALTA